MIQVTRVCGHASCSVRTTGKAWQTSPSAERRRMQIESGGAVGENRGCTGTGLEVGRDAGIGNNPPR